MHIGGLNEYLKQLHVQRLISCCDLTFFDSHLAAAIALSDAGNPALNTTNQTLVGAINEINAAVILENTWDRNAGPPAFLYPHVAGDRVRSDSLLYCVGGGLPANWIANSITIGHDVATHYSFIQSAGAGATALYIQWIGGQTNFGGPVNCTYPSGSILLPLVNGSLVFDTNESNNAALIKSISGKQICFGVGSSNQRALCFTDPSNRNRDHGQPLHVDTFVSVYSATDPSVNNTQYAGFKHDKTDEKHIIGKGSIKTEHKNPVELANNGSFDLPNASSGFGFFQAGDGEEYGQVSWTSAGVVTTINGSANFSNTDTGAGSGDFCIFDNGTKATVINRMGAAKKVIFDYHYFTP